MMSGNSTPLVTVIIATYNKSEALHYAIKSVLWQTFSDFECWIIGDACTDDSPSVVAAFNDPRLNWCNLSENSGYQSAPNNEGLRRAKGKYIAYLNHDDIWLPNHLQVLVDCIEQNQADFAFSIMEMITPHRHYADIPEYPDAPRPPEASATIHRLDVVDRIGFWKAVHETNAIPRVEYFRQAQFAGMSFKVAARLTVLKFSRNQAGYSYASQQEYYLQQICQEPDFVENELANLLIDAYWQLEAPISRKQLHFQLLQGIRKALAKRGLEPDRLMPWLTPGKRMNKGRKHHGLDPK